MAYVVSALYLLAVISSFGWSEVGYLPLLHPQRPPPNVDSMVVVVVGLPVIGGSPHLTLVHFPCYLVPFPTTQ